jgi:dihydrodipicolinate synthase/N-acetylneuraminate lyase
MREGWRDYLLHDTLPIGVVSGPGNVLPREWQKSWRACWAGDEDSMSLWSEICQGFEKICAFEDSGRRVRKTIACLKYALELDGVIGGSQVAKGTNALTNAERESFAIAYRALRESITRIAPGAWQTRNEI